MIRHLSNLLSNHPDKSGTHLTIHSYCNITNIPYAVLYMEKFTVSTASPCSKSDVKN